MLAQRLLAELRRLRPDLLDLTLGVDLGFGHVVVNDAKDPIGHGCIGTYPDGNIFTNGRYAR